MNKKDNDTNNILEIYNSISEKKINNQEYKYITSKIDLISNMFSLDTIELIQLIDILIEFKNNNQLNKINNKTINLIKKITDNGFFNLEGTLYFPLMLKHLLLPFNLNNCIRKDEILLNISNFEILLELITIIFNEYDFSILEEYNCELTKLSIFYRQKTEIYKKNNHYDLILNTIISHLYALFYFNQDKYNYNYKILDVIGNNIITNYEQFIDYCSNEGIYDNFSELFIDSKKIEEEYIISKKMLDYVFNSLNKNKEKRKC